MLALGLVNGNLLLLNNETNKVEFSYKRHSIVVSSIDVNKEQDVVVSSDALGDICVWKYDR